MLILKNSLKDVKSELCPHCDIQRKMMDICLKIDTIIEEVSYKETSDKEAFDFYSINEDDWLLP